MEDRVPRIACLLVPDLAVAAACRADPKLIGIPLALSEGTGPHARVVAASPAARARGVQPGRHSIAQARVLAADLVVRPRDPAVERSALQALAQVAASLASRIEPTADGAVFLDAATARSWCLPAPSAASWLRCPSPASFPRPTSRPRSSAGACAGSAISRVSRSPRSRRGSARRARCSCGQPGARTNGHSRPRRSRGSSRR
ncbi:MAG: hypothetical protein E6J76_12745 [Deltaproteobacteria bacterium]|nr:MAG: hypothetical protein E6J76_12745 [Deltaproteobacteria bacterium]